jgi:hypothetical protein
MFQSIINTAAFKAISLWLSRLTCPEVATASHEVGSHQMGSVASSFVDYGYWPDSARRPG